MKKLIGFVFCFGFFTLAFGQQREIKPMNMDSLMSEVKNSKQLFIKTNPISLLTGPALATFFVVGEAKLLAEYQVGKNQSVEVGASYLFKSPFFDEVIDTATNADFYIVNGYRVQAGYRLYVFNRFLYNLGFRDTPQGITGFFISPHVSYAQAKVTTKSANQFGNYYQFSLLDYTLDFGLQLKLGNFVTDGYMGFGYKDNKYTLVTPTSSTKVITPPELDIFFENPYKFRIGFNLGWRF